MRGGLPSLCFALLAGLLAIPMRAIVRVNPRLRIALFGLVALVAAALIPNGADAAFMSAEATFTTGQGDNCREGGSLDDLGEGTTTQSASFNCTNVEGFSQSQATASAGSVGASALAHSFAGVNRGSESSEGAQGIADYSDTTGVFNGTFNQATVTLNTVFNAFAAGTGSGGVFAIATIDGQTAATCIANSGGTQGVPDCQHSAVTVTANRPISISLHIEAAAQANASGGLFDVSFAAAGLDTFSFPIGGPVFDLPDGITFNDPDAFIFDNIYSPPGAAAAVPEPGSLMLLLSALGGLLAARLKTRKL